MITFHTLAKKLDLTNKGLTFTEKSDHFNNKISKNFSFPINLKINEDLIHTLGLVNIKNVNRYNRKIYGKLVIDNVFYNAYLAINNLTGNTAEVTFFYGDEILAVFDKKLNTLPFGYTVTGNNLPDFAKTQITKTWPEATHNFVKVFREDIKTAANYNYFENFVNNYKYNTTTNQWEFPVNTIEPVNGENVPLNKNVMSPMPYLLEVFKVGFQSEGLFVGGDFMNSNLMQKICMVPKNYFEKFSQTEYNNYSFDYYTAQETLNGQTINVYKQVHTPTNTGAYSIKFDINLSNALAQYFDFKIKQNSVILYEASSINQQVNINDTLNINIVDTAVLSDIEVELRLKQQTNSIAPYNNFTYERKEGQLNVFPDLYTIADFMPDITFKKFVKLVKNWLNLSFEYTENAVYINFLDSTFNNLTFQDKSHLEQVDPRRTLNENNLFKLSYKDGQEVLVSATGQIYNTQDFTDQETTALEIEVLPLTVTENFGSVTAVYPNDEEDIMLCLYNGLIDSQPLATDNVLLETLKLDYIYTEYWQRWLLFRANAETYKDSFNIHISDLIKITEGLFKYNKKHIIKSIRKKRISSNYWKATVESETL